jgi:acetyl-CoA/propionyl-CoA carboxylase, biotin carboxylase, biotin carboxyl carrier protein
VETEWDLSELSAQAPTSTDDEDEDSPSRDVTVEVDGRRIQVRVFGDLAIAGGGGKPAATQRARKRSSGGDGRPTAGGNEIASPMQGTVVKYAVDVGDTVSAGDLVVVVEAMKMENHVTAQKDGTIAELTKSAGDSVNSGEVLARLDSDGAAPKEDDPDEADAADVAG